MQAPPALKALKASNNAAFRIFSFSLIFRFVLCSSFIVSYANLKLLANISYPTTKPTYGKYGLMREDYLKQHNPELWNRLMLCGKLTEHLNEIHKTARERIELMMPELMKSAGATEELKRTNPLKWVGLINACKSQAEDIVFAELVYC